MCHLLYFFSIISYYLLVTKSELLWPTCESSLFSENSRRQPWTCPNEELRLWQRQSCDGVRHCRSGFDENCVTFLNTTNKKLKNVVNLKFPYFDCSLPLCYNSQWATPMMGHLFCRLMNYATYDNIEPVTTKSQDNMPAILGDVVRCRGGERTLHQCFTDPIRVSQNCTRLLSVKCKKHCQFNITENKGFLKSPGYPIYALPDLRCFWRLKTKPLTAIVLQILDVNLYEFPYQRTNRDFRWFNDFWRSKKPGQSRERTRSYSMRQKCTNSLINLRLGKYRSKNGMIRQKMAVFCNRSVILKNFTSTASQVTIGFFSGAFLGSLTGPKGFHARFWTIPANQTKDYYYPDLTNQDDIMAGIAAWLKIFIGVTLGLALFLSCVVLIWLRNAFIEQRKALVRRVGIRPANPTLNNVILNQLVKYQWIRWVSLNVFKVDLKERIREKEEVELQLSFMFPSAVIISKSRRRRMRRDIDDSSVDSSFSEQFEHMENDNEPNIHHMFFCQQCGQEDNCEHVQNMKDFLTNKFFNQHEVPVSERRCQMPSFGLPSTPKQNGTNLDDSLPCNVMPAECEDSSIYCEIPFGEKFDRNNNSSDDLANSREMSDDYLTVFSETVSGSNLRTHHSDVNGSGSTNSSGRLRHMADNFLAATHYPFGKPQHTSNRQSLGSGQKSVASGISSFLRPTLVLSKGAYESRSSVNLRSPIPFCPVVKQMKRSHSIPSIFIEECD